MPAIPASVRRFVAERAGFRCEYCGLPASHSSSPYDCEHIIASAAGGSDDPDNLAYSCSGCNGYKHATVTLLDALSGEMATLFNPRSDHWKDHFVWQTEGMVQVGISPTGRDTIEKLRLNRQAVVNLRRVLLLAGVLDHG
jgi:hypothetical protein